MNELDLFKDFYRSGKGAEDNAPTTKVVDLPTSEVGSEVKTMTTKEIAEQLGTSPQVIARNAKKCLPNKVIEHGKTTYYTVEEVTVLLDFMKKNNNRTDLDLYNRSSSAETELTPALKMKQAWDLMTEAYEEELSRLKSENAEKDLVIADKQRTLDTLANADGCKSMAEAAKTLGFGQNNLFAMLRGMGVLFYDNGVNLPYQKYVDAGYFVVKMENFERYGVEHTYSRIYVTARGMLWLERKLKGGVEK